MVLGCQLVFSSHSSFSSDMPVPYVYQFGTEKDEEFCTLFLDVICFSFILFALMRFGSPNLASCSSVLAQPRIYHLHEMHGGGKITSHFDLSVIVIFVQLCTTVD